MQKDLHLIESIEEEYGEGPLHSPEETVRLVAERKGLQPNEIKTPEIMFLSLSVGATEPLIKAIGASEKKWLYRARPLYVGEIEEIPVGIIWAAPGAPVTAMTIEDLAACGSRVFIGVGLSFAIQPNIEFGDLILPNFAVRDDGTSHHYLPRNQPAVPSANILHALKSSCEKLAVKHHVGPIWSTDAPYRETRSKLEYYLAKGILGVDMESSTLFTVGNYRKVSAGCLLVASSNLNVTKHGIGFYSNNLKDFVTKAANCAVETVRMI